MKNFKTLAAGFIAINLLSLSGCIIHVGGGDGDGRGVSSIFGGLSVSKGKTVDDVSSVNGSIELASDVTANNVETVNGSIELSEYVNVSHASTVNGDIDVSHHFTSQGSVETVNGDISILQDSVVKGVVETVNGDIKLHGVQVEADVTTKNGDIKLSHDTVIAGDVVFKEKDDSRYSFGNDNIPTLVIKDDATVIGNIILLREVELEIENQSLLAKVKRAY